MSGQLHTLTILHAGKEHPSTHWVKRWVGTSAGLHAVEREKKTLPGVATIFLVV
jgi:hypothetical protein